MNSRTNFRLQLQREQLIQEQQKMESSEMVPNNSRPSVEMVDVDPVNRVSSSPMAIKISNAPNHGAAPKTLPVIISQPIRFSGNRLVHLPPQIIHVQQQQAHNNSDDMGRKNMTLSSSLPIGFVQSPLAKTPKLTNDSNSGSRVGSAQQQAFFPQQVLSSSKQSSAELSPAGYADSPRSVATFLSAQSELDDVIIDEILSMEEEQQRRKLHHRQPSISSQRTNSNDKLASSLSYGDDLETLLTAGRTPSANEAYQRQVSNSAPSSGSVDIEGLVRDELVREQELMRDRRKKDVHNMIERRRRYNINDRIKELGTLLPKSCTEEMKLNKGTILQASVEYILSLRKDQERLLQLQQKQHLLESENRRMSQKIQSLESQMKANGLKCLEDEPIGNCQTTLAPNYIKTEPLDEADESIAGTHRNEQRSRQNDFTSPTNPSYQSRNASGGTFQSAGDSGGHSYAISAPSECQGSYYTTSSSNDYDAHLLNGNNLVLIDGRQGLNSGDNAGQLVNETSHQQHQQFLQNNSRVHDLIMELGGADGCVTSPGLLSTVDPMMCDTRLINSQVPSPDIHWDSATFSPEANEHMDFVVT